MGAKGAEARGGGGQHATGRGSSRAPRCGPGPDGSGGGSLCLVLPRGAVSGVGVRLQNGAPAVCPPGSAPSFSSAGRVFLLVRVFRDAQS